MAIEYFIASDSDNVYAVLENTFMDVDCFVDKVIDKCFERTKPKIKEMYVARTNPKQGDKYDEDIGMRVAKDKLLIKYYNDKIHDLLDVATALSKASDEISDFAIKCFNTRANYVADLQEVIDNQV